MLNRSNGVKSLIMTFLAAANGPSLIMWPGVKLQLKASEMGNYGLLYIQLIGRFKLKLTIQQGNLSWLNSSQLEDMISYF